MPAKKPAKKSSAKKMSIDQTTVIGSDYAQFANVSIGTNEVTYDFIYAHPSTKFKEGNVIARITMPKNQALALAQITQDLASKA